jgi:hypothetical protein
LSYHEGGKYEDEVAILRRKQNLLATGIVYPPGLPARERIQFEAALFLEINSNQTSASPAFSHMIGASGLCISESSSARKTSPEAEELPDADRV